MSFGLAVHFRMYPIIYAVPFIVVLDVHYHVNWNYYGGGGGARLESRYAWSRSTGEKTSSGGGRGDGQEQHEQQLKENNIDRHSIAIETKETRRLQKSARFSFEEYIQRQRRVQRRATLTREHASPPFSVVTFVCYWKYGQKYLNEAILYHVSRKDPRHNFAPNFFSVYLDTTIEDAESGFGTHVLSKSLTKMYAWASKITQYSLTFLIGIAFAYDLPFAMFAQTFAFVAFNSVITSQYFAWWCALLPIGLATSNYSNRDSVARVMSATVTWIVSKLVWLKNAHSLEMLGEENGHFNTWAASCGFLASANLLRAVILEQRTKASLCPRKSANVGERTTTPSRY